MEKMTYLAGPMTGYPQFNHPLFNRVEKTLVEEFGWHVFNPVKSDSSELQEMAMASEKGLRSDLPTGAWEEILALDMSVLIEDCDSIIVLEGWEKSQGARIEVFTALTLHLPIFWWDDSTQNPRAYPTMTAARVLHENTAKAYAEHEMYFGE